MKKFYSRLLIFCTFVIVFIAAFSITLSAKKTEKHNASASSPSDTKKISPDEDFENSLVDKYVITAENSKLFLNKKNGTALETIQSYEAEIYLLPEEDKKLLQEGIETDNLSDALQIIEDYLS